MVRSVTVLLLLLLAGPAGAQVWSKRAPLPEARQEVAVAQLHGRVYVIGGFRADRSIADTVEVYDPGIDRWSTVAAFPTPIHHTAAVALGDRLYAFGGWPDFFQNPSDAVWAYDPAQDRWEPRAAMPSARAALAAAALDRKIYVVGGSPLARERDFAAYDPALDEWDPLPPMPSPRNHLAAGAAGRRIYAVGGRSGGIAGISAALEAFDVDTGLWQPLEPMPTARGGIAAAVVGHFLIVYGGEGNPDAPAGTFEEVEAFDTQTGDWLALSSMVTPRHGIGAARVGGRVHVPGGGPVEGFGVSEVHEIHDPLEDLALDVPLLAPVARALIALLLLVTVAGGAVSRWRAPASLRSASSPPRSRPSSWP